MIQLYQASGASGFTLLPGQMDGEKRVALINAAMQVLAARDEHRAERILGKYRFQITPGTNDFNDEFFVLHVELPLTDYEELRRLVREPDGKHVFSAIAEVLSEIGPYIRFIAADLLLDPLAKQASDATLALKPSEIKKIVYGYIGVNGGYLGDFSYRSHQEFYHDLDLDINPFDYDGTTRERFTSILRESVPDVQALILDAVLTRYPVGSSPNRTDDAATEIRGWVSRLRSRGHRTLGASKYLEANVSINRRAISGVFICYANQDVSEASRLYEALEIAGARPWMDKKKMVHGDVWESEIKAAVSTANAFVVCLRPGFDDIGFRQQEVRWALEALSLRPPGRGFVIPYVIEPCELPDWCKPFHAGNHRNERTSINEVIIAIEKHTGSQLRSIG